MILSVNALNLYISYLMFNLLIPSWFLISLFRTSSANMNKSRDNRHPCVVSFWIIQDFARLLLRITYKSFICRGNIILCIKVVTDFAEGPQVALKPSHGCFPHHLPSAQALGEEESIIPSCSPAFLKADRLHVNKPLLFFQMLEKAEGGGVLANRKSVKVT